MSRRLAVVAGLLALLAARPAPSDEAKLAKLVLSGHVLGASNKLPVFVALWDEAGFLSRPVQEIRLPPGTDRAFRFEVTPGRWAVSAFEDRNGNGILDMGLFGPKEPSGFWRPFHAWRKPRFDDVASRVDHDVNDANLTLK
jgi:uncharacterized protein (DUF2141 family)